MGIEAAGRQVARVQLERDRVPTGHDIGRHPARVRSGAAARGRPSVILAHTVMGQGVSYMADDYRWHGKPPKPDQAEIALERAGHLLRRVVGAAAAWRSVRARA